MKLLALYFAHLKAALRYLVVLLVIVLALVAVIVASLPKALFDSQNIPAVSLALVFEGESEGNALGTSLASQLGSVEVIDELHICNGDEADELLARQEVDAVVVLPEDMLDVLVQGGHAIITVKATDPLLGAVVYSVTEQAAQALDTIQNYSLVYADAAREHLQSKEDQNSAISEFNLSLMNAALMRLSSVDEVATVSPLYRHVLSLLLFLTVSVASFFLAVSAARQYSTGYVRRLKARGVRFGHLLASQILLSASLSAVLALALGLALLFVDSSANLGLLLVSAVLLSVVLTPLFLLFAGFRQKEGEAPTRTLLGCLTLLFFLLFAGGGFYPSFLMESPLRLFNPTWMSELLAGWTLGAPFDAGGLLLFAAVFVLASAGCLIPWRRAT